MKKNVVMMLMSGACVVLPTSFFCAVTPPVPKVAAAKPAAPKQKKGGAAQEQKAKTPTASIGERGNWLKKREWVKQASAVDDQVQKDLIKVQGARAAFMPEFEKIDKKVNEFFGVKGLAKGKMTALVDEIKAEIAAEKERRVLAAKEKSEMDDVPLNYYDVQVEAIEDDIKKLMREIDQFNLDMKAIADLDAALNDRLKVVDKHIKDANVQAEQSAKKLEEMWWLIDDQKARERFYEIQAIADRVSSIKTYLTSTLLGDFKKTATTLEKQIEQVQKEIEHRERRLAQKKVLEERQAQKALEEEEDEAPMPVKKKKKNPWWYSALMTPIEVWTAAWEWTLSLFGGSKKAPSARKRRE
jgi:hypothetical protein